jgi:hypothetical protein
MLPTTEAMRSGSIQSLSGSSCPSKVNDFQRQDERAFPLQRFRPTGANVELYNHVNNAVSDGKHHNFCSTATAPSRQSSWRKKDDAKMRGLASPNRADALVHLS